MKLQKKSELIKSVLKRYKQIYCTNGNWRDCFFGIAKNHRKHYELLKKAATEDEIENIIGNTSWTRNECSECEKDVKILVRVGGKPNYESATAYLCFSCIEKALKLITDNQPLELTGESHATSDRPE